MKNSIESVLSGKIFAGRELNNQQISAIAETLKAHFIDRVDEITDQTGHTHAISICVCNATYTNKHAAQASAWAEGHLAGWEDRDESVMSGWTPSGYEPETENPYKQATE